MAALRRSLGLVVDDGASVTGGVPGISRDPRRGFASLGEYFKAVCRASANPAEPDERLFIGAAAPSTYGNEQSGQDGGFAIPPLWKDQILQLALGGGDSIVPLCDDEVTSSNSMVFPTDQATPWGTSGIRAYWQNEATVATPTKPSLSETLMRVAKLIAYVPLSQELADDANALGRFAPKAADAIAWKVNEAIIRGPGNGQPLGILNSPALVVQAKESGQLANTISIANCANMIARLPPGSFNRSVWMVDASAVPTLLAMNSSSQVFFPNGGFVPGTEVASIGTLIGRPVIVSQHCASLSSQGDLILADFKLYRWLTTVAGLAAVQSLHVYFDQAAGALRYTLRCDGSPEIAAPITPNKAGSLTMSPFIALAAR
jgi:HK97 family phage major capsid protein